MYLLKHLEKIIICIKDGDCKKLDYFSGLKGVAGIVGIPL